MELGLELVSDSPAASFLLVPAIKDYTSRGKLCRGDCDHYLESLKFISSEHTWEAGESEKMEHRKDL